MRSIRIGFKTTFAVAALAALALPAAAPAANPKPGTITEFTVPTANSVPFGITAGADGNMYFTEVDANKIGKLTLAGKFTEYPIPSPDSNTQGISAGPNPFSTSGNSNGLWFTECAPSKIGRLSYSGQITEFASPGGPTSTPCALVSDAQTNNIWIAQVGSDSLGLFAFGSGSLVPSDFAVPKAGSAPYQIALAPGSTPQQAQVWFTEVKGDRVGSITSSTNPQINGKMTEFDLPNPGSGASGIAVSDNQVWFAETLGDRIGMIDLNGKLTEYQLPAGTKPYGMTIGPAGAPWFTALGTGKVGTFAPTGDDTYATTPTFYSLPSAGSVPRDITMGPDGNLWITESGSGDHIAFPGLTGNGQSKIARLVTGDTPNWSSKPSTTSHGLYLKITSGKKITTKVTVPTAGKIAIAVGRTSSGSSSSFGTPTGCDATKSASSAGTSTLTCSLNSKTRSKMKKKSYELNLQVTYTLPSGQKATITNSYNQKPLR